MIRWFFSAFLAMGSLFAAAPGMLGEITWSSREPTDVYIPIAGDFTADVHQAGQQIIVDLHGVRPHSQASRTYRVGDGVTSQIRVGDHPPLTVRVVIDLGAPATYTQSRSATGIAIKIRQSAGGKPAAPRKPASQSAGGSKAVPPPKAPVPQRPVASAAVPVKAASPAPAPAPVDSPVVELAPGFELSILDDTAQDLPYVLRMYHGYIGFATSADSPLQQLYQGPDWLPIPLSEADSRLSAYFALQFTDDKSSVAASLRLKYNIPRGLIPFALFPKSFVDTLHREIRDAAAREGRSGKITQATILFTMLDDHGIQVKRTTVVPR